MCSELESHTHPGTYLFYLSDGYIVASWIALFIAGMGVQFYMGRKGPDFPESPRAKRRQHRTAGRIYKPLYASVTNSHQLLVLLHFYFVTIEI